MVSKVILTLSAMLAVAAAVVPGGASPWGAGGWGAWGGPNTAIKPVNPWIPPWISAPWYPQWEPCTAIGSSCLDCNTKLVCTKVGALQRLCSDPTLPYCDLGECSATPSAECTVLAVPADAAV